MNEFIIQQTSTYILVNWFPDGEAWLYFSAQKSLDDISPAKIKTPATIGYLKIEAAKIHIERMTTMIDIAAQLDFWVAEWEANPESPFMPTLCIRRLPDGQIFIQPS